MNVVVDFKYGEPIIATVFDEYGNKFMKSEVKVKIPPRPCFCPNDKYSCTEAKYLRWKNKAMKSIDKAILKSLNYRLYGTVNIHINMEKHHGL